jgi:hypothetical protein
MPVPILTGGVKISLGTNNPLRQGWGLFVGSIPTLDFRDDGSFLFNS